MSRRVAAIAALLVLAHAGAARADDCEFEGVTASLRSPVEVFGDTATVLANVFADGDANGLGNPDDLNGAEYTLPMRGPAARTDFKRPLSPTLAGRGDAIRWEEGRGIVAGGRVLVPRLPFPGYEGVAAAEARDGTITLLYGAGGNALLQRFAPDGTPGAPIVVAPAAPPEAPDDAYDFSPRLTVDKEGTVFGVAPGVAIRWPASGDPQLIRSRQVHNPGTLVADQYGGAYLVRSASPALVHLTSIGVTTSRLRGVPTNLVVDEAGVPAVAYTAHGRAYVRRSGGRRSLGPGEAESIAWYRGHAWTLVARGDALDLVGPHSRLRVRARPHYGESGASLAISPHGRAWAVWDEESDRLDQECDEFPVSEQVQWASFGLHDRSVIVRGLPGAATLY